VIGTFQREDDWFLQVSLAALGWGLDQDGFALEREPQPIPLDAMIAVRRMFEESRKGGTDT
jgi:hypothetical protein